MRLLDFRSASVHNFRKGGVGERESGVKSYLFFVFTHCVTAGLLSMHLQHDINNLISKTTLNNIYRDRKESG